MSTPTRCAGLGSLVVLVVATFCFLQAEPAAAQGLKLPTTWDYVQGFTKGGIDAWNAVQSVRGRRGATRVNPNSRHPSRRGMNHPPVDPLYSQHFDPHYVPPGHYERPLPENAPHRDPDAHRFPDTHRVPGDIRPIEEWFADLPGGAIVNLEEHGAVMRYRLNGRDWELPPGHYQDLGLSRRWVIEFDRGGHFGHARYAVGRVKYTFTPTEHGWELFQP